MRYRGAGCTIAEIGPPPNSLPFNVAITCGAFCAPGQKGQCPGWPWRSTSSPTMTQERVIGSLRNSMLPLGKQTMATMVNRGFERGFEPWALRDGLQSGVVTHFEVDPINLSQ